MTYTPDSGGWSMGDYDFELDSNSPSEPGNPIEFERRIPITHSTGRILANRLERFLEEEAELDTDGEGVLSPQDASAMEIMRQEYISRDLISISLSSIDEAIDEFSADLAIRSGRLIVDDISVIDAFGQVIEFQTSDVLNKVRVGLSLETPDDSPGELMIKPRIPRGARLNLRLLSNDEDDAEANSGSSILELDPDDDMIPLLVLLFVVFFFLIILNGQWKFSILMVNQKGNLEWLIGIGAIWASRKENLLGIGRQESPLLQELYPNQEIYTWIVCYIH